MRQASQTKPLEIFAPSAYTWDNKGDAALVMALVQSLRREFGQNLEIEFTSLTPEYDTARYGLPFIRMPLAPRGVLYLASHGLGKVTGQRWIGAVGAILQLVIFVALMWSWVKIYRRRGEVALRLLPTHIRRVVEAIERCDIAVAVPGGYLKAPAFSHDGWLYHAGGLILVKLLGKPLILYPCSIGPFDGVHRKIAALVLRHCDIVLTRETVSRDLVVELGVSATKTAIIPDSAFMLEHDERAEKELPSVLNQLRDLPKPWLGISVRDFSFPGEADPNAALEEYLDAVASTADRMIKQYGVTVVFVPQSIGGRRSDVQIGMNVHSRMANRSNAIVLTSDVSPQTLREFYGRLELLIGTRMHANILAMTAGTPVVAIAYEHKTTGIMDMLDLSDYTFRIADTRSRLLETTLVLWERREIVRAELPARIAEVTKGAYHAVDYVRSSLCSAEARN